MERTGSERTWNDSRSERGDGRESEVVRIDEDDAMSRRKLVLESMCEVGSSDGLRKGKDGEEEEDEGELATTRSLSPLSHP